MKRFTPTTVLRHLRVGKSQRLLVVGDPLSRYLLEIREHGFGMAVSASHPLDFDLHGAWLPSEECDKGWLEALQKAKPIPKGDVHSLEEVLGRFEPGSWMKGVSLYTVLLSLARWDESQSVPWSDLIAHYGPWATGRVSGRSLGRLDLWDCPLSELLLKGRYQALLLFLAPTLAETRLGSISARLGYPDRHPFSFLKGLEEAWLEEGIHQPKPLSLIPVHRELDFHTQFQGAAGLRSTPMTTPNGTVLFQSP
ncbi:hypothetical protein H8D30_02850 [bacterium]|nr:hypothetical protein [bacterium]